MICLERLQCSLCKLCIGACEAEAIDLKPIGDSFAVSIEGSGSVAARGLVARAVEEIKKRMLLT
jgi:DNA-directed RNA polymerase subunit D